MTDPLALVTEVLQRPIRYQPARVVGYVRHLGHQGLPVAQRLVQTELHAGLRRGDAEQVDPALGRLLGRPARDLADYTSDRSHLWDRSADSP